MNKVITQNKKKIEERDYVDPILFEDGIFKDYDDYEEYMGKAMVKLVDMSKTATGRKKLKKAGLLNFVKKLINSNAKNK